MTRSRNTPYPVLLGQHLSALDGGPHLMSAKSLYGVLERRTNANEKTAVSQIHRALRTEWSEGRLLTFVDDDGNVLREEEFCVPGSAAIAHPQIFATPGTPSPEKGYRPVTYDEAGQLAALHDEDAELSGDEESDLVDDESSPTDPDQDEPFLTDEEISEIAGPEFVERLKDRNVTGSDLERIRSAWALADEVVGWKPEQLPPAWLPDHAVRCWVSLPSVIAFFRKGLDAGPPQDRIMLRKSLVQRKGAVTPSSGTARVLATWARTELRIWKQVAEIAVDHYIDEDEAVAVEDLSWLKEGPLDYYMETDVPGEVVLLIALAVGSDEGTVREIAEDWEVQEQTAAESSVEEQLRFQLAGKDAESAELRSQNKELSRESRDAQKQITKLTAEIDRLRASSEASTGVDERFAAEQANAEAAEERATQVEAELEAASEAAEQLKAQLEERDMLETEKIETALRAERALRIEAEAVLQAELKHRMDLSQQLREARETGLQLPLDDPRSVIVSIAGAIGTAAQHAAGRLAAGHEQPEDAQLLGLAGTFADLARAMRQTNESPPRETSAPAENAAAEEPAPGPQHSEKPPADLPPAAISLPGRRRRVSRSTFTVRPIGGAGEVGGSAILVQTRTGASVLLDAGQRVKNAYGLDTANPFHVGIQTVERLDAILVSHAHIDHIGSLPLLHRFHSEQRGDPVPVYMSEPTRELGEIMLLDSAKIQHSRRMQPDALAESDFGPDAMGPVASYDVPEVNSCLELGHMTFPEPYKPIEIPNTSLVVKFIPVAHVLGSCAIHLKDTETGATLLYSGDLGPFREPQLTLPGSFGIETIDQADMLLMESTYGLPTREEEQGRRRAGVGRDGASQALYRIANEAIGAGGHVLLPAFSLGRTQELIMLIGRARDAELQKGPIYIAGMGERINVVYDKHASPSSPWGHPSEGFGVTQIKNWLSGGKDFSDVVGEVLESEPGYIIASPAMVSSGWSRAFMDAMLDDERHAIVFTGYLPKHAGGIDNLRDKYRGAKIRLPEDDRDRTINCEFKRVGLSAHAPMQDLHEFAAKMVSGRDHVDVGLVHGAPDALNALSEHLRDSLENASVKVLSNSETWSQTRS